MDCTLYEQYEQIALIALTAPIALLVAVLCLGMIYVLLVAWYDDIASRIRRRKGGST